MTVFSINLDPIVKCLEGIRSELARANKLSEEQLEMTESRYQQIAIVEAQFLDNAHSCAEDFYEEKLERRDLVASVAQALRNGHDSENCIDPEGPSYCAGLYWPLWQCHEAGVTEESIRQVWPKFPGYPAWKHVNVCASNGRDHV